MVIDQQIITGVLGGSMATLIIKGIIDSIAGNVEYRRSLKKEVFSKKLRVAEKATAYFWTYLSKAAEIKAACQALIETMESEDDDRDIDAINEFLAKAAKASEELVLSKAHDISAIHLYFDVISSEDWNELDQAAIINVVSRLKHLESQSVDLRKRQEIFLKQNKISEAAKCGDELERLTPKFIDEIKNLIALLERERKAMDKVLRIMKTNLV